MTRSEDEGGDREIPRGRGGAPGEPQAGPATPTGGRDTGDADGRGMEGGHGPREAMTRDAGARDEGERDAGERDAGERDGGERDGGERDGGERDGGQGGRGRRAGGGRGGRERDGMEQESIEGSGRAPDGSAGGGEGSGAAPDGAPPVFSVEAFAGPTLRESAARLGHLIGLGRPAPEAATRRALAEPLYARALHATRHAPALRDRLLAAQARPRSPAEAVRQAVGGVLKWGMEGLRPPPPWVLEKRLAACAACEFRAPAPDTLLYRGARVVTGKGATICTLCDCLTNTKAAISTELCPATDPNDAALSRWGDPWVPPREHPKGPW